MDKIEISNLTLSYVNKTIIKDLTLDINKKQIVSIIGPNGSGKSTILKSLSKLLKPEKGVITIGRRSITDMTNRDLSKQLSILLQHNTCPLDIKVKDLIYYGRLPHKKWYENKNNKDEEIVTWVIKNTNIEYLQNKKISCLSGGERQRVWLAVALAQQPKILLLDEPTTYLDISYQLELLELVKKLNKKLNITIIMVLHELNQAAKYSDRIIVLKAGKIFADGEPKLIITKDMLKDVYNVDADIFYDKVDKYPIIIPKRIVEAV